MLETREAYFWATRGGAELDLLITIGGRRYGFEFKYADAPGATRSMRTALEDLNLEKIWVVYPGAKAYEVDASITVTPLADLPQLVDELRAADRR